MPCTLTLTYLRNQKPSFFLVWGKSRLSKKYQVFFGTAEIMGKLRKFMGKLRLIMGRNKWKPVFLEIAGFWQIQELAGCCILTLKKWLFGAVGTHTMHVRNIYELKSCAILLPLLSNVLIYQGRPDFRDRSWPMIWPSSVMSTLRSAWLSGACRPGRCKVHGVPIFGVYGVACTYCKCTYCKHGID